MTISAKMSHGTTEKRFMSAMQFTTVYLMTGNVSQQQIMHMIPFSILLKSDILKGRRNTTYSSCSSFIILNQASYLEVFRNIKYK